MIKLLLLIFLEKILNKLLLLNPDSLTRLRQFEGSVVALSIPSLKIVSFLRLTKEGVLLLSRYDGPVTTKITGSLLALLQQIFSARPSLHANIKMEGNSLLAQNLLAMIKDWPINHEEVLSYLLGDVVSHALSVKARQLFGFQYNLFLSLKSMLGEYLQEEMRVVPPKEEVEDSFNDISILRNDVERLEIKLQHFRQRNNLLIEE